MKGRFIRTDLHKLQSHARILGLIPDETPHEFCILLGNFQALLRQSQNFLPQFRRFRLS